LREVLGISAIVLTALHGSRMRTRPVCRPVVVDGDDDRAVRRRDPVVGE
jgi:hypothetical protein